LTSIAPNSKTAGDPAFTLTVTGTNFIASSVVRWNGADRATTYGSSTQLTATIPATDIATAGTAPVTVFNPAPGGGLSSAQTFTINAPNPTPTLNSISPASATAGGAAFTLVVTGTNFLSSSVVRWNGVDRTTTFISATQLQAAIAASDIAAQGTASVTVFNPAPGGGTSNTRTFSISGTPVSGAVTYVYDRLGRLGAVVDHDGNAAIYTYDAVGNLLSIGRQGPTAVSIIDFSPGPGTEGTSVTIYGVGFSATPGNNTVTFNGTPGVVISATSTQITTNVPAGATSGTIVVTTAGGSGSSATPFTVLVASDAPSITGFTPTIAMPGTAVTVSGTNFVTSPTTNNRLRFSRTLALPDTVTSSSIATTVPPGTTSGRLSIATPTGSGVSAGDFFVPPAPLAPSDIAATDRLTIGGSSVTVSIPSSKAALLVFDGTAGQQVTLGYSSISPSLLGSDMTVYRPEGGILSSQAVGFFGGDTHIASLPVTGTYQVLLKPQGTYSGNITVTLSQDLSVGPLVVGGSSATANITRPGQRARASFAAAAGQRLSLHSTSSSSFQLTTTVTKPDGSTLFSGNVVSTDGTLNLDPLPVDGTYTVVLDPEYANTLSFDLLLSEAISSTIAVGGASVPVNISRAGQRARISFDGTTGQRLSIGLTSFTLTTATFTVLKPDGTALYGPSGIGATGAIDLVPLPTSGTYVIQIDPSSNYTGAATLLLSEEISGSVATDGSPVTVSIPRAGQRARLTFTGTANQRVSMKTSGVTIGQAAVSILKPDGSTQAAMTAFFNNTQFLEPTTLATSGTYAVLIDPAGSNTGDITVTLYDVPANPTGSITVNGPGFTVNLTAPGQTGDVSFFGTSAESITIHGANSTMSGCMTVALFEAGGTAVSWNICTSGFTLGRTLGSTGTHVIRIDPDTWNTGSVDISVSDP
jgi:YD repeat-containing protein